MQVDISTKSAVVVPLHVGAHWAVAYFDLALREIVYYDSARDMSGPGFPDKFEVRYSCPFKRKSTSSPRVSLLLLLLVAWFLGFLVHVVLDNENENPPTCKPM